MPIERSPHVAYVLKTYPRFSQTFVVREVLEHEAAGWSVPIFSLRQSDDARFHQLLGQVRSPVTYINRPSGKASALLGALRGRGLSGPALHSLLDDEHVTAGDLEQALVLAAHLRRTDVRHIHAHFGTVATTVARLAARICGIGYSFTAHARDIFHDSVDPRLLQRKLNDATRVITVSRFNQGYLEQHFDLQPEQVEVVYNGLDTDAYAYRQPRQRAPLILGVGRLVEKKGFRFLIDACSSLKRGGYHFRCEIVGPGVLREELRKQISNAALDEQVTLTGPLSSHEVIERLYQASVLAAPCIHADDGDRDGLPTILLEAMALGTPCISTDVTGITEVLIDEQTGLLVPQRDGERLAAACARIMQDADLRCRLSANARGLIESTFDIRSNTRRLREVFVEATTERPQARLAKG